MASTSSSDTRSHPHDLSGREALGAALAVAGEAIVVLLAASQDVPAAVPLLLHVAVVMVMAVALLKDRPPEADPTVSYIMLLVTAVSGPAGAMASLCALPFVGHAGAGPEVLDAWYDRLSSAGGVLPQTAIHDRIAAGRVLDWQAPMPKNFLDVIVNGTLADKQEALGLMARTFHTDFAPALQAALRSPEPVVRVQASAVVARVRADLKARIKSLIASEKTATPQQAVRTAAILSRYGACALVDRADQDRCRAAATRLLQRTLASGPDVVRAAAGATPMDARQIETYLIEARRFKDLRVARRIHDLARNSGYRVRRILPAGAPA